MLKFLPATARGAIALFLLVCNTLFWCLLLLALALVKVLLPLQAVRAVVDPALNALATAWIRCNRACLRQTQSTIWDVEGVSDLRYAGWYLVNCNHQSWVDIFVLQNALSGRIPLLKFFLKHELIYVPVIGLAWLALDFPFMKRHDRQALRKNPQLRDQDRESTKRACAKFALVPTSVTNFAEGTRFTPEKHRAQGSPYRHLLKPKAGALALALNAMGRQFHSVIDATIVYPDGVPTFWSFLCGRSQRIVLRVRQLPIPPEFSGSDYETDAAFRRSFHRWVAELWTHKDQVMDDILNAS